MGEMDWLEEGHGRGDGLQPVINDSPDDVADRVSIRGVLRPETAVPRKSRRRNKALVGWLIYCSTAVGGTAAAFTVRDTLFPSLGAPAAPVLWATPPETNEHGSTTTGLTTIPPAQFAVVVAEVGETTVIATPASVDDQTVPSASSPNQGPGNSVDDRGSGGVPPVTGTTVPDDSGQGPSPGTTVADDPTQSSTPTSVSTPPTGADTTSTTPASPDNQRGKGGGSGGGGGGGGGKPPTP